MSEKKPTHAMVIDGRLTAVFSAAELADMLCVAGDADEWARNLNGVLDLQYSEHYVVPHAPEDYSIYYTTKAATKIVAYEIRRQMVVMSDRMEKLLVAFMGGRTSDVT